MDDPENKILILFTQDRTASFITVRVLMVSSQGHIHAISWHIVGVFCKIFLRLLSISSRGIHTKSKQTYAFAVERKFERCREVRGTFIANCYVYT
jgi:hypothetical protein